MKIRKNVFIFAMVFVFSFVLAACGNSKTPAESSSVAVDSESTDSTTTSETDNAVDDKVEEDSEKTDAEGNILVAYFSHTGNTKEVAQKIAEYTGGELAEIQRAEEYEDLQEEAEAEIKDGIHPEITVSSGDVADFQTIFVGYPIWWDEAPAMIATFLADNDFAGKRVVPFCTSASDDIGNSLHIFNELCPGAEIAEGLTANDLNDIEPWLQELGLMK